MTTPAARLLAHLELMQDMARRYVTPEPYVDRNGKRSDELNGEKQGVRDNLFAADMIYMLDGPEQREAQDPGIHVGDTEGDGAGGEAAIAIAEHAFKSGWEARGRAYNNGHDKDEQLPAAWSSYDPPEQIKDLA